MSAVALQTPRTEPTDHETEAYVLGALLLDPTALAAVESILQPRDLDDPRHVAIYTAVRALDAAGAPVDLLSVARELQARERLHAVGGHPYLVTLTDACPTTAFIEQHARALADLAAVRRAQRAAQELTQRATTAQRPGDLGAVAASIGEALETGSVDVPRRLGAGLDAAFTRLEGTTTGQTDAVGTGFKDLDRLLAGGLRASKFVLVGARRAVGKTAVALNLARAIARDGGVLFESLEMPEAELIDRLLVAEAGVDNQRYARGLLSPADQTALAAAADRLDRLPLWVQDTPGITLAQLRGHVRYAKRAARAAGTRLAVVVIDYVALMRPEGRGERHEGMAELSRQLKVMAKREEVCVIALAQLHKAADERKDKTPRSADLRESQQFENDADVVALLHRAAADDPSATEEQLGDAELLVVKQRGGPCGVVKLRFVPAYGRFHGVVTESGAIND